MIGGQPQEFELSQCFFFFSPPFLSNPVAMGGGQHRGSFFDGGSLRTKTLTFFWPQGKDDDYQQRVGPLNEKEFCPWRRK